MQENIIESKLYGGKVTVKFLGPTEEKPSRHMYMVDGIRKTGVTTILGIIDKSRPLIIWATGLYKKFLEGNIGEKLTREMIVEGHKQHTVKLKEASDIGTEIHDWIELHIKKKNPEMPQSKEAQIGVNAFLDWVADNKVKFITSERLVYSKKYDYIGTLDIEAKVNGKLCLIDIKSSNAIYNTYYLQTAAYLKADEEESGKKYDGRWIIRLAKETEREYNARMTEKGYDNFPAYEVFEAKFLDDQNKNIDRDYKAFLSAKELFMWNKETDPWMAKSK